MGDGSAVAGEISHRSLKDGNQAVRQHIQEIPGVRLGRLRSAPCANPPPRSRRWSRLGRRRNGL